MEQYNLFNKFLLMKISQLFLILYKLLGYNVKINYLLNNFFSLNT